MSKQYWFKKRTTKLDFGRPANWKGWAALLVFIFLFAMVVQLIARWFMLGMAPLAQGVWLFAMFFVLMAFFLSICNRFSPPFEDN